MLGQNGIPIGNLTSQIFSNIYLNELDRFVVHSINPQAYLRYGDDFIVILKDRVKLYQNKIEIIKFLNECLGLEINPKNEIMIKAKQGLKFLGVEIFGSGRRLNKRNWQRVNTKMSLKNISSYRGLVRQHSNAKKRHEFDWLILEKFYVQ